MLISLYSRLLSWQLLKISNRSDQWLLRYSTLKFYTVLLNVSIEYSLSREKNRSLRLRFELRTCGSQIQHLNSCAYTIQAHSLVHTLGRCQRLCQGIYVWLRKKWKQRKRPRPRIQFFSSRNVSQLWWFVSIKANCKKLKPRMIKKKEQKRCSCEKECGAGQLIVVIKLSHHHQQWVLWQKKARAHRLERWSKRHEHCTRSFWIQQHI